MKALQPHPLGSILPMMGDADYNQLLASIEKNGFDLSERIVLFEGKILDGNNRATACYKLKLDPVKQSYTRDFDGSYNDAVNFVIQKNLARRNLTPSQSAAVGAELAEKLQADPGANLHSANTTKTAAKITGVSPRSVAKAKALKKEDPEGFAEVKAGTTTLHAASKLSKKDQIEKDASESEAIVTREVGVEFANVARAKLTHRDLIQLSGLEKTEMERIKPYIEDGWKLDAALSYKAVALTKAHTIRQLCERAVAAGTYVLEVGDWVVTVKRRVTE